VPKRVIFVDDLPRNASGKILKRELRARLAGEGRVAEADAQGAVAIPRVAFPRGCRLAGRSGRPAVEPASREMHLPGKRGE
ncbi:MAG TPA: hypothetical protein VIK99_09320, partial [Thermaerobacter sp.]